MDENSVPSNAQMADDPIDDSRWETLESLEQATGTGFLGEIVDLFLNDTPGRLTGLREAVARRDGEAGERFAHSLKGSSSNLGASRVESLAHELERRLAAGSFDGVDELLARLEVEYDRARRALRAKRPG